MLIVPCTPNGSARWTQRTTLGGRDFVLSFAWIQRDGAWYLDIADQDGAPIATARRLGTSWPPLVGVHDARQPPGLLVVLDATGADDLDPGFADLGTRFLLTYFDPGELA